MTTEELIRCVRAELERIEEQLYYLDWMDGTLPPPLPRQLKEAGRAAEIAIKSEDIRRIRGMLVAIEVILCRMDTQQAGVPPAFEWEHARVLAAVKLALALF